MIFAAGSFASLFRPETKNSNVCGLFYYPEWVQEASANFYMTALRENISWRQEHAKFATQTIPLPRLTAWYGDPGASYKYSGIQNDPIPWNDVPILAELKLKLENFLNIKFNSLLCNYYRSGQDSVGWHTDAEPGLNPKSPIASISFGQTRKFQFRRKEKGSEITDINLEHGSLLVMPAGFQENHVHQVPKSPSQNGERINLTFRNIII